MTVPETDGARGDGPLVVIPCLNEAAHIRDVLETVLRDPVATSGLVVIADGGSTDGTQDIVRSFMSEHACIRLLDNPKRIQSAGVNLAVRRFGETRRWLVRLDAHSQYPENYVGRLIEVARATGAGSVVVAMQSLGHGCFQRAAAAAQNSRLGTGGSAHRMGAVSGPVDHGHHALMSLPLFAAVGGYDEHMATNEDAELDVRLAAQGALIWLSVENAIGYYPRATALRLMKQYFRFGVGRADTVTRHRLKPRVRQLVVVLLAPAVLAVALAPVLPMALETVVLAPTLVWAGVSLSLGIGIGVRSRSLCAAAAGPAAMIMHLSWSVGFWWFLLTRGVSRLLARGFAT
jgi:succinoglycan biosynthesis protein ExoA